MQQTTRTPTTGTPAAEPDAEGRTLEVSLKDKKGFEWQAQSPCEIGTLMTNCRSKGVYGAYTILRL